MGKSFVRMMEDAMNSRLGRTPLRFSFEIIPKAARDLPEGATAVSLVWEKGRKVSYTDPENVQASDNSAKFAQVMRQTATVYKAGNSLLPQEYNFKLQSVQSAAEDNSNSTALPPSQLTSKRRTIARCKLDLAQYCCPQSFSTAANEVEVPLLPQGTLQLSIRAVWLQHYDAAKAKAQQQKGTRQFLFAGGSPSDFDSSTDVSSIDSSMAGSCISGMDREELCSGSAELNRLLQEAEARHSGRGSPSPALLSTSARSVSVSKASPVPSLTNNNSTSMPSNTAQATSRCPSPPSTSGQLQVSPFQTVSWQQQQPNCSSSGSRRHRRVSSLPEHPPIMESDAEGGEGGQDKSSNPSCTPWSLQSSTAAAEASPSHPSSAPKMGSATAATQPMQQQKLHQQQQQQVQLQHTNSSEDWRDTEEEIGARHELSAAAVAAQSALAGAIRNSSGGPDGLRSLSGSLPAWLWPSSRLAVRDVTTDELMRRISNSKDVSKLQHICRGLLCDRNDWRSRCLQAERLNGSMQQELQSAQVQLQQKQSDELLLGTLVDAKLQLAQADLTVQDLKGQLMKERERSRQTLAKLTSLQTKYDALINEQQAAAAAAGPVGAVRSRSSVSGSRNGGSSNRSESDNWGRVWAPVTNNKQYGSFVPVAVA